MTEEARFPGRVDRTGFEGDTLPAGLHCYELDARGARLTHLPDDLRVDARLVLDECHQLTHLPEGLTVGSLSLRNCTALTALPEGLSTWFLDLTGCTAFQHWPRQATIERGALILRDCVALTELPGWLGRLSQLDLAGCAGIRTIPDGIEVTLWLDIGGTSLTSLPPSLKGAPLRWRGVRVDERIALRPHELTAREALQEPNAERRRVMIERMGALRFVREADPAVLDEDRDPGGERRLLRIELEEDEPLVGLFCQCPSTGRQYLIRVPPQMKSCHQAAAWIAGFDEPSLYQPCLET